MQGLNPVDSLRSSLPLAPGAQIAMPITIRTLALDAQGWDVFYRTLCTAVELADRVGIDVVLDYAQGALEPSPYRQAM